jgi:microsomal dipeptidase-like Zn-dependent dipeptidase
MLTLLIQLLSPPSQASLPPPVPGFADLHVHLFAEHAFGGAWLHGTVEGEISKALASCDSRFDPLSILGDHARVKIPIVSRFIAKTLGSSGDTGEHREKSSGYPDFEGWPRWDTIAHQQVHASKLKEAHDAGLNLMVVSLVNYEPLCELMPEENKKTKDCSDMNAVRIQLKAAHDFESRHPWFKIVRSAKEARQAIRAGKLAVVLSIEATHLFGDGAWEPELELVWNEGVRTLQIAHQEDNRFAGVAIHNPMFRVFAWLHDFQKRGKWTDLFSPSRFGFQTETDPVSGIPKNRKGLTEEGKRLAIALMRRGAPIDIAHLSERTVTDLMKLQGPSAPYPLYVSHGHFRNAMDDGKFSRFEKSSSESMLDLIRKTGGIFGLRTGPERTRVPEGFDPAVHCQGSSISFAHSLRYGTDRGVAIAFGSDLNGFIQQTRPRFGGREETCGAETDKKLRETQQKAQSRPTGTRFDRAGLGDISELPHLLEDLKNQGADTRGLEASAEAYLRMWEQAEREAKSY